MYLGNIIKLIRPPNTKVYQIALCYISNLTSLCLTLDPVSTPLPVSTCEQTFSTSTSTVLHGNPPYTRHRLSLRKPNSLTTYHTKMTLPPEHPAQTFVRSDPPSSVILGNGRFFNGPVLYWVFGSVVSVVTLPTSLRTANYVAVVRHKPKLKRYVSK